MAEDREAADRISVPGRLGEAGRRWVYAVMCAVVLAGLVIAPGDLKAHLVHLALRESTPAAGGVLAAVPEVLRLSFTEPVELALSTIVLRSPAGEPVDLGELRTDAERTILVAPIVGILGAGMYRVEWVAVGRDGHPVRDEFTFEIAEDAEGIVAPSAPDPVGEVGRPPLPPPAVPVPAFTTRSPLYAGVRWLMYVGIVATLGALGFFALLRSSRLAGVDSMYRRAAARGAAAYGILGLLVLGLSLPLRLQAQSHVVFGDGVTRDRFAALLGSTWGTAWAVQLAAFALGLIGMLMARGGRQSGWWLAGAATIGLVLSPAMAGHASALPELSGVAVAADALHIAGAGLWIGTLGALLVVGLPALGSAPEAERREILSRLVIGFSPLALGAAAVLIATGVVSSSFQLAGPASMWTTGYGRLLSAKLVLVAIVLSLGAFNWRRLKPAIGEPGADVKLRRSGGAEVTAALVVILLTAVLVGVQPPRTAAPGPQDHSTSDQ